jgi:hypothetical protein
VLGQTPRVLSSRRHDKAFFAAMWSAIANRGSWQGEIGDRRKSGEVYPKWLQITALRDGSGEGAAYIAIFTDITERKQNEDRIHNLAYQGYLFGKPAPMEVFLSSLEQSTAEFNPALTAA